MRELWVLKVVNPWRKRRVRYRETGVRLSERNEVKQILILTMMWRCN